jgi:cardiolipin synthase
MIAAVSDAVDGFIARYMHARSKLGAYLDPLADKLLFFFTFLTLGYLNVIPFWLIVLSIGRDAMIVLGIALLRLYGITIEIKPLLISKMNTFIQSIVVVLFLVMEAFDLKYTPVLIVAYVLVYANVITLFISGIGYILEGKKSLNRREGVYLFAGMFIGLFILMMPPMVADGSWLWQLLKQPLYPAHYRP